jgi:hypothetical protein
MNYTCTRRFTTTVNGRRKSFILGDKATETLYNKLTSTGQNCFVTARQYAIEHGDNVTLTNEQFMTVITEHRNGNNRADIRQTFRTAYPDCKVPTSSLNMYCGMCEVLDPNYPDSTEWVCNKRLVTLWNQTA